MRCKTTATYRMRGRLVAWATTVAGAMGLASRAGAEPLRLRADALAETQGAASPAGLVVLQGQDAMRPWVDAEALVWTGAGAGAPSPTGDVLVLTVRLREPHGYAEMRAGRFVLATGAVHPVQIDGAARDRASAMGIHGRDLRRTSRGASLRALHTSATGW